MRYISIFIIFFVAGGLLGFVGVWNNHQNEKVYGASYPSYKREIISNLALPGFILDSLFLSVDYQLEEVWENSRYKVALLNGLFTGVSMCFIFKMRRSFKQFVVSKSNEE